MNELYINGQLADLSDFTRIGVTIQANNIGELQNRQGDFTNTFKLPLTQRNIEIIGISNDVQSNSSIPYQTLTIDYLQDGVPTIAKGRGVIEGITDTIAISVTSGNTSLSDAIGDLIVGDLFEDETPFTWNLANVISGGSYWNFPLIDWRSDIDTFFDTDTIDVRSMLPVLPIPILFQKLEDRIDFNFQGAYIDSVDHNSMVLTPSEFTRSQTLTVNSAKYLGFPNYRVVWSLPPTTQPPEFGSQYLPIKTNTFTNSEFSFSTNSKFIPATNQVGILKFSGLLNTFRSATFNDSNVDLYVQTFIINHTDGIILSYQQTEIFTTQMNIGILPNFNITFQTDEMNFIASKEYRVYSQVFFTNIFDNSTLLADWSYIKFEFQQTANMLFNSDISFRDLFRMKVVDVFKDILNLRCLIVQTDDYSNIVKIDYLNKVKTNAPLDWTDKLANNVPELSFLFGKYARRNWLRFKNNTNVPDQLADAYFDVSNMNLEAQKDMVKILHPATEQRSKFNGFNIPKVKAINSTKQWQKPDYRLLQVVKQDTDFDVNYTDGTTTTAVNTQIPFANFIGGDLLINSYYSTIQAILDKSKVIRLPFRLTPLDVQNVDHLTPIKVECFGTFYLNKIENFKDEITICELVRL
jgi:hypothetical protein